MISKLTCYKFGKYIDKACSNLFDFYIFQDSIGESKTNVNLSITDDEIAGKIGLRSVNIAVGFDAKLPG